MKYHWATCPHCGRKFFKYEEGAVGKIDIKCPSCKDFATINLSTCGQMELRVQLDAGAFVPERAHDTDAGMDLKTQTDILVPAGGSAVVDTGVHVDIPVGYVGMLKSKSGLNVKSGIVSEGVIDAGYTGSIVVKLYNHSPKDVEFERGQKITQLVIMPVALCAPLEVKSLDVKSERGANGFGSTGA